MKQYCRYCVYLVTGNGIYCTEKHLELSEAKCKRVNYCKDFELCSIDAFGENDKGYQPRARKKPVAQDVQITWEWGNE